MTKPVYIRGRAVSCSLGQDIEDVVTRIRERDIPMDHIPLTFGGTEYTRPYFRIHRENESFTDFRSEDYFYDILYDTVSRALDDASLSGSDLEETAIFLGSTSIDIPLYEGYYEKASSEETDIFSKDSPGYGRVAAMVAARFGIRGGCYTFATACTSTANAAIYASAMISSGMIKRALVIGYDLYNDLGFFGFESLILITPGPYAPFDKNRKGIIMGEGCGALVLDSVKSTEGAFRILGGENICDTNNVTTHEQEGSIIARVMTGAMKNCGLSPSEISIIKAHATGTVYNDKSEVNGMKKAFGDTLPPVTGIKPYMGHTVGAAGATELIVITECVARGFVPATPGFREVDDELNLVPLQEHVPFERGVVMLNYFGFGGNCTSMIISNKD